MASDIPELLRTARHGCWQLKSNSWGQYLAPTPDPLANVVLTDEQLQGFELHDNISPLPAELWQRWVQLCFHFARERAGELEVSCRLLRHEEDKSQWRLVIPPQEVGGVSVHADNFDGAVDIVSGEVIESWPPSGWLPCGSSHSHNTMQSFFSGTDDKYELGDPGLHIVVGSINLAKNTYTHKASITAGHRRFLIDTARVVDLTTTPAPFHPDVLAVVQLHRPKPASLPQQWSRPAGFFDPNAGNGYGNTYRWQANSEDWPIGWINDSSADPDDLLDDPLGVDFQIESIDELIHDAIHGGMEQEMRQALQKLRDHIDITLSDLELSEQLIDA